VLIRYFAAFAHRRQPESTVCLPRLRAGGKPASAFRDHALSTSSLRRWNRGRPESPRNSIRKPRSNRRLPPRRRPWGTRRDRPRWGCGSSSKVRVQTVLQTE